MKIIFLSFSDHLGGASMAAYSIFKSIKKKNSFFLTVYSKFKDTHEIFNIFNKIYTNILRIIEKIIILLLSKKKNHQSLNIFDTNIYKKIKRINPDIINLHWINRSMISLKELNKITSKVIVSLHDMWFLNSTEHYSETKKYKNNFLENYCWREKKKFIYKKNTFFIAHNKWMQNQFIKTFPKLKNKIYLSKYYPINCKLFKPRNKILLRKKFKLPEDKIIILYSAQDITDKRKGYIYYKKILNKLSKNKKLFFLSLGNSNLKIDNYENYRHYDYLTNKKSAELYSLSDIYLCTSLIDNLPLTILEALSSGNLVVSFDSGGASEVLKQRGYIFKKKELQKLINFLDNIKESQIQKKSILSRKFSLKNFNQSKTRSYYIKIFNQIEKKQI